MAGQSRIADFNAEQAALIKEALTIIAISEIPGALDEDHNGDFITPQLVETAQLWVSGLTAASYNSLLRTQRLAYEGRSLPENAVRDYCQHLATQEAPVPQVLDYTFYNRAFLTEFTNISNQNRRTAETVADIARQQAELTQQQTNTAAILNDVSTVQTAQREAQQQTNQILLQASTAFNGLIQKVNDISVQASRNPNGTAAREARSAVEKVQVKGSTIGQFQPKAIPDPEAAWSFLETVHQLAVKFGNDRILAVINQCFSENEIARNWYHSLPSGLVVDINANLDRFREVLKRDFFVPRHQLREMADQEVYKFSDSRSALEYLYRKVRLCRMAADGALIPQDPALRAAHDTAFEADLVARVHEGIREPQLKVMMHAYVSPQATIEQYATKLRDVMTPCKEQAEQMHSIVQGYMSQYKSSLSTYNKHREPRRPEVPKPAEKKNDVRDVVRAPRAPKMIGKATKTWRLGSKLLRTCQHCDGEHYDNECSQKGKESRGYSYTRDKGKESGDSSKAVVPFKGFFAGLQDQPSCEEEEDDQCLGYFSDEEDSESVVDNESSTRYDAVPHTFGGLAKPDVTTIDQSEICMTCGKDFRSRNRLHRHLTQTQHHGTGPTAIKTVKADEVIPSDNLHPLHVRNKHVHTQVRFRLQEEGPTDSACADTGCGDSAVDRQYLEQNERFVLERIKFDQPKAIEGMGGAVMMLTEAVRLPIYLPATNHQQAHFTATFYVFDNLGVKLLFGVDTLVNQRIDIKHDNKLVINACQGLTIRTVVGAATRPRPHPVRSKSFASIPGEASTVIPLKPFQSNEANMFRFVPNIHVQDHGYGTPHAIIAPKQTGLLATNWLPHTVRIRPNRLLGWAFPITSAYFGKYAPTSDPYKGYLGPEEEQEQDMVDIPAMGEDPPAKTEKPNARYRAASVEECLEELETEGQNAKEAVMEDEPWEDVYTPTYQFPLPPDIVVGGDDTCTHAEVDINTKHDISEQQVHCLQDAVSHYRRAFNSIPGLVREPEKEWMRVPVAAEVEANIKQRPPYAASARSKQIIDRVFDLNTKYGRMQQCPSSPYSLQVFVAAKDRPVVDMRPLNSITIGDAYPLPRPEDVTSKLRDKSWISTFDVTSSFYQRMIHPDDAHRTAAVTHRGQEMFRVAPMGFKRSPAHQQRLMDRLIREGEMGSFMSAYIDDVIIYSDTFEEHVEHVKRFLKTVCDVGMTLKATKCHVGYHSIDVLGKMVDRFGICTTKQKAAAILQIPPPASLNDLEKFIGLANWHRQLIPYFAQRIRPLQVLKTELNKRINEAIIRRNKEENKVKPNVVSRQTRAAWSKKTKFTLTDAQAHAFQDIQTTIASPQVLHHFNPAQKVWVFVDASRDWGFGYAAYQEGEKPASNKHDKANSGYVSPTKLTADTVSNHPPVTTTNRLHPIAFGSRELKPAERNYWPTELEMAGVVWTARKLKPYLEMTQVEFVTDHQANEAIAKMKDLSTTSPAKQNLKLQSWAIFLSQFWDNLTVTWHKGAEMECPDALSRLRQSVSQDTMASDNAEEDDVPFQFGFGGMATPIQQEKHGPLVAVHVKLPETLLQELRDGYEKDKHLSPILRELKQHSQSDAVEVDHIPFRLEQGLLFFRSNEGYYRLAIPEAFTRQLLAAAHDHAGHMGVKKTLARLVTAYYWKNMRQRVMEYVAHCPECLVKNTKHHLPFGSLHPIDYVSEPFYCITLDLATDLPPSSRFNHGNAVFDACMVVTCKFTKLVRYIPGQMIFGAKEWCQLLFSDTFWGIPAVIITDRDGRFTSGFWKAFMAMLHTKHVMTTAYHAAADGQSERSIQFLMLLLRFYVGPRQDDWAEHLTHIEHAVNSAVHAGTGQSPYQLLMGFNPKWEVDLLARFVGPLAHPIRATQVAATEALALLREACRKDATEAYRIAQAYMKKHFDNRHAKPDFSSGYAYINLSSSAKKGYSLPGILKAKMAPQRSGPYPILEDVGGRGLSYRLDLPKHMRIHPVISVIHLEPAPPPGDPFHREIPPPAPVGNPTGADKDGRFEITKILRRKVEGSRKRPEVRYLVRWKEKYPHDDTWVKESTLQGCEALLQDFELYEKRQTKVQEDREAKRATKGG